MDLLFIEFLFFINRAGNGEGSYNVLRSEQSSIQYSLWNTRTNRGNVYERANHWGRTNQSMTSRCLWPLKVLKSSKEHLREANRNCSTAAATRIVLKNGTVASEASPTTVRRQ